MRAECQEAEASLSYLRRLIQGRLDIVHAYMERPRARRPPTSRASWRTWPASWPVPGGPGPGRNPVLYSPDTDDMAELTTELDAILGADDVGRLTELDDDQLADLAGRLRDLEVRVSAERRGLHERIDTLQAELVARHKSGLASVDGLLS